ncbi:hypothetical protein [Massilia glaciei]|uniref:hypothetical protein n=1 Tax=Massilia glaciei TaxID=1524097 RepID=UPI00227724BC|nr:hypothetical protein [Massilia glaciei]
MVAITHDQDLYMEALNKECLVGQPVYFVVDRKHRGRMRRKSPDVEPNCMAVFPPLLLI